MKPYKNKPISRRSIMGYQSQQNTYIATNKCPSGVMRGSVQQMEETSTDIGQGTDSEGLTSLEKIPALYTIDIPDNSLQMRLFEQNHPRLYRWLNTGLGQKYLEMQRGLA